MGTVPFLFFLRLAKIFLAAHKHLGYFTSVVKRCLWPKYENLLRMNAEANGLCSSWKAKMMMQAGRWVKMHVRRYLPARSSELRPVSLQLFEVSRQPCGRQGLSASCWGVFHSIILLQSEWGQRKSEKRFWSGEVNKNPFCHSTASPHPASFSRALSSFVLLTDAICSFTMW